MLKKSFSIYILLSSLVAVFLSTANGVSGPCALLDTGSSSICISIEEINSAFRQARVAFNFLEPFELSPLNAHTHHDEVDQLGNVLVETSRILAKSFNLDYEQIFDVLPKLDVELTDIWKFCPVLFRGKKCKVIRYRTLSGHCNNINHPDWGAAVTPFRHILPSERDDGLSEPRDYGKDQSPLPSARIVSSEIHHDKVVHDHAVTVMLIAWGQIIDHDITFTAETKDHLSGKDIDCCSEDVFESTPRLNHHNCYPIRVPHDDSFYSHHNQHCMSFARSLSGVRTGCKLGTRTAFNTISSFLDASFVYGYRSRENIDLGKKLRSGKYGTLRMLPLFEDRGLKDLLPLKTDEPDDGCIRPNSDIFCFLAGDNRVNEQLVLTTLHTIFLREHNKIAHALSEINSHWDDEKLYQETRRIIIAVAQHITYNEFLPMILGRELLHEYALSVEEGYWTGYDPNENPSAFEEFVTSAFRFGHSLLPHRIERWSTGHHYIDSTKLHEMLRQPFDMFRPGYADSYIMGLVNQLAQVMDEGVTDQVTTLLFKEKGKQFGMDLAAMNIQRGRDHGVPPYAAFRKICDLTPIHDWDDLIGVMRNETVYKYKQIYRSPWDIDLWSGGVSEIPKAGALIGPTFGCIIAKQFHALRYGDRFWYELPDLPSSFILEQLNEIKSMKLSRLLCDNGDDIKSVQVYAMVHPDHEINPRVSCYGKILPRIDLELWRDSLETPGGSLAVDSEGHQSVLQKAHLYTDLETLKPPLYDSTFIKLKHKAPKDDGISYDKNPEALKHEKDIPNHSLPPHDKGTFTNSSKKTKGGKHSSNDPLFYEKFIPSFQKMPDEELLDLDGKKESDEFQSQKSPFDGDLTGFIPPPDAKFPNFPDFFSEPPSPLPYPRKRRPSLLRLFKNRGKFLMKIFRKRRKNKPFDPFPSSPFPGMGGVFSPNPGYLVRQNFWPPAG